MSDHDTRLFKRLHMYCDASAIAAAGVGCLVLFGWAFHIEHLKSVIPGLVTMKANTALGLAFSMVACSRKAMETWERTSPIPTRPASSLQLAQRITARR